jgi:hypothetical protein
VSARTVGDMVSSVSRAVGGGVPLGEIQQALFNANLAIGGKYPWPWLTANTLITLVGPYNTGTVTLTSGSTAVVGVGTTWDTSWKYKTLRVSNIDYDVASIDSTTALTLVQAPILDATLSAVSYSIVQDVYALPSDYIAGSDVNFQNQGLYYDIKKIPQLQLLQQNAWGRLLSSSYVSNYCDWGFDDTAKVWKIKVNPPPAQTAPCKFIYRRKPPDLSLVGTTSILPESFVEMLERFAEVTVRRDRKLGNWREPEAAANQMLYAMKRAIDTQGVVNRPEDHGFGYENASWKDGLFQAVRGTS